MGAFYEMVSALLVRVTRPGRNSFPSSIETRSASMSAKLDRGKPHSRCQFLPAEPQESDCLLLLCVRIPQFVCYSDRPHLKGKIVACTQPRRLAATSVAKRVADEMDRKSYRPSHRIALLTRRPLNPHLQSHLGRKSGTRSDSRMPRRQIALSSNT